MHFNFLSFPLGVYLVLAMSAVGLRSVQSSAIDVNIGVKVHSGTTKRQRRPNKGDGIAEERRSLDEIYRAALAEGGRLVLYQGGDLANAADATKQAFEARFPNMTVDIVVDYSKFHGPRVDFQLAQKRLVPDAVQLQTLQDFPRWKAQGALLQYKPAGWDKVYKDFRDSDAYYTGIMVLVFSNIVNQNLLDESQWPKSAQDYLRPELKGKLAITPPNDDDAVLFWFNQTIDKYGWDWFAQFVRQDLRFVRGTVVSRALVLNGTCAATMTSSVQRNMVPSLNTSAVGRFPFPADGDPFTAWAQYYAIMKQAKRTEAAKLFLNWMLAKESPVNTGNIWSVRTDIGSNVPGVRPIWETK